MLSKLESIIDPFPAAPPKPVPKGLLAFLWMCSQGVRSYMLAMTILTAAIGIFEAFLFAMMGRVVDWVSAASPATFWVEHRVGLILLAALLFVSPIAVGAQTLIKHQVIAINYAMLLRWNFHRLMLGQSMTFFQDEFAGRVAAKVMQTALAVRDSSLILGEMLVFALIYFFTMMLLAGSFDAWLILPFLGWLVLYLIAVWYFVPRLAKVGAAQADARSLMTGRVTDAYTNVSTVKLFSHARREANYARDAMKDFMKPGHAQMRLVSGFEFVNHTLSMMLLASTTVLALWLWSNGQLGIGSIAASTAMALRLNGISHWVMWEMATLFEHIGTVQDGINTLSRGNVMKDEPDAATLVVPRGELRFEDVSFAYGGKQPVVSALNLRVAPGEKIGLVGRSGAGKSTILNLLLRFYDVESGRIVIDGQAIAGVTQESLRAQMGMVTQDTSLLHRSVRDNLMYGRPDATEADMIAAARRAEAHDFIVTLADAAGRTGYDAHVGERGVKLSGGQRQRIAIARVMLKDAPILLLDEATSALDSEVEAAIQQSLYRLMEGKTVVAIAHRLSTIAAMDRLIVLDKGYIVEEGDHESLLASGGLYARLWAHQSGGFLGEVEIGEGVVGGGSVKAVTSSVASTAPRSTGLPVSATSSIDEPRVQVKEASAPLEARAERGEPLTGA
ncbi:ABC transporter ATP-binding protein [soil metagenome]